VPVYRYWNGTNGDHFYTTDFDEGAFAAVYGYGYEGVSGYIYDWKRDGTVPLHRYVTTGAAGDHYYTKQYLPNGFCYGLCYNYEGQLGWVFP
jgi:hypothetical protein